MKTFIYEYGLFIVALTGALLAFSLTSFMKTEFKELSSKYIQNMPGVENAEYDPPDNGG